MKDAPGPTFIANMIIIHEDDMSAFSLLIEKFIINITVECTQAEPRSKNRNDS